MVPNRASSLTRKISVLQTEVESASLLLVQIETGSIRTCLISRITVTGIENVGSSPTCRNKVNVMKYITDVMKCGPCTQKPVKELYEERFPTDQFKFLHVNNLPDFFSNPGNTKVVFSEMIGDLSLRQLSPDHMIDVYYNKTSSVVRSFTVAKESNIKWFSMEANVFHDAVQVPIGMCPWMFYEKWAPGRDVVPPAERNINVMLDFGFESFGLRKTYYDMLKDKPFVSDLMHLNTKLMEIDAWHYLYWDHLSKARYNICPFGAGFDTSRFYESLCLHTIPVVLDSQMYRKMEKDGCPILFVDSFDSLTGDMLNERYDELFSKFETYIEKITQEYVFSQIQKALDSP